MCKFGRVAAMVLLAGFVLGEGLVNAEWIPLDRGATTSFKILETKGDETIVEMRLAGFEVEERTANGETFNVLSFPNCGFTDKVGFPQMPVLGTLLGVRKGAKVKVEFVDADSKTFYYNRIWPCQAETDCNKKDFVISPEYQSFSWNMFEISQPKVWRDMDIVELKVYPLFYYPSQINELVVYSRIVLKITQAGGEKGIRVIPSRHAKMYKNMVLNYQTLGYQEKNVAGKYLFIVADTFLTEIQPLVKWYFRKGYFAEVAPVSTIGNTPEAVKAYILDKYENGGLDWVLLVGNINQIPLKNITGGGDWSDSWYSFLKGEDYYAEIAIGRLSIREDMSLSNVVQKILDYEKNPLLEDWLTKSVLVAHSEAYPGKYSQCKREIFEYDYSFFKPEMDTLMGGVGASNADVTAALNEGRNVINYRGHGDNTEWWEWGPSGSWTNNNIEALTNGRKTGIVYNIACSCHGLGCEGICIGEAWLAKENGGAVASYGATRPSYTYENHDRDKALYWAPFDDQIFELGWVSNYASAYTLPLHANLAKWNTAIYLWLGDPAMEIWTGVPKELDVEHPETANSGEDFLVEVRNGGQSVPNALVCLAKGDELYEVGYTSLTGQIIFFPEFQSSDSCYLTVTTHDYLPYEITLCEEKVSHPKILELGQNSPNPFNGRTEISYALPANGLVSLALYDVSGRLVKTLVNETQDTGFYSVSLQAGKELSKGVYFYRLAFGKRVLTKKMVLLK